MLNSAALCLTSSFRPFRAWYLFHIHVLHKYPYQVGLSMVGLSSSKSRWVGPIYEIQCWIKVGHMAKFLMNPFPIHFFSHLIMKYNQTLIDEMKWPLLSKYIHQKNVSKWFFPLWKSLLTFYCIRNLKIAKGVTYKTPQ